MAPRVLSIALILIAGYPAILANDLSPAVQPPTEPSGVDWSNLLQQSAAFLTLEHGFRWAAQPGTRHPHRSFFGGYVDSLNSLHGWADGDPFLVNYVGHPMQGAVSAYIFVQNDRQYRTAEFGKNRRYWKSRLRAAAYSWAYSEQFEIGPLSEASIGNTQSTFPQHGFADQIVTPAIGFGWMIVEDSVDRYVIKRMEARVHNRYLKILVRGGLNPSRSLANAIAGRVPWHRDTRPGVWETSRPAPAPLPARTRPPREIAPLEFLASSTFEKYFGSSSKGACIGGGGTGSFRVGTHWQIVGDVSGCKLTGFGPNLSGDSLTYLIGPRWTSDPVKRWVPYAQILAGGRTLTHEEIDPVKKLQLEVAAAQQGKTLDFSDHSLYTRQSEITRFAVSARAGIDVKLTSAIAIRALDAGYTHSWNSTLDGINYSNALHLASGLILRFGTW